MSTQPSTLSAQLPTPRPLGEGLIPAAPILHLADTWELAAREYMEQTRDTRRSVHQCVHLWVRARMCRQLAADLRSLVHDHASPSVF